MPSATSSLPMRSSDPRRVLLIPSQHGEHGKCTSYSITTESKRGTDKTQTTTRSRENPAPGSFDSACRSNSQSMPSDSPSRLWKRRCFLSLEDSITTESKRGTDKTQTTTRSREKQKTPFSRSGPLSASFQRPAHSTLLADQTRRACPRIHRVGCGRGGKCTSYSITTESKRGTDKTQTTTRSREKQKTPFSRFPYVSLGFLPAPGSFDSACRSNSQSMPSDSPSRHVSPVLNDTHNPPCDRNNRHGRAGRSRCGWTDLRGYLIAHRASRGGCSTASTRR
jgi:hypothetical protein